MTPRASRPSPTSRKRWLPFARVAWVVVAVITLGAFASSVPARYAELALPTKKVSSALAELGLSAGGYALYNVALDTIFVSVFGAVAIVIFWRRSDDPVALLVATMLVVWGPLNGLFLPTPSTIEETYPVLGAALGPMLTYVGYIAWMLFFYLFPSGHFVPRWTLAGADLRRFLLRSLELYAVRSAQLAAAPFQRSCPGGVGQLPDGPDLPLRPRLRAGRASADQVGGVRRGRCVGWRPHDHIHRRGSGRPPTRGSRTEDAEHAAYGCLRVAHPALHRHGGAALTPLRHRHSHQPHPRLRLAERDAGAGVPRRSGDDPGDLRALTGQEQQPQLAIVISTLVIAALFNPL